MRKCDIYGRFCCRQECYILGQCSVSIALESGLSVRLSYAFFLNCLLYFFVKFVLACASVVSKKFNNVFLL